MNIVAQLRGPNGCPWDLAQTHHSLAPYAIEEAFELAEACELKNASLIREELGDFLFQVVLHCQLAAENKDFCFEDVVRDLNEKMIRRHPHVFSQKTQGTLDEIWREWSKTKRAEKKNQNIFNIPTDLPAIQSAQKIGRKTKGLDFFWQNSSQLNEKVLEELEELSNAKTPQEIEEELGDLLFTITQYGTLKNIDSEQCLRAANRKFILRFESMLEICGGVDKFLELTNLEKENLWNTVKKL